MRASGLSAARRLSVPVRDWLLAGGVLVVAVGGSIGESYPLQAGYRVFGGHVVPAAPWPAYLLVAAAALVLGLRTRYPIAVLVASTAAVAAYTVLGYVNGAALAAPAVALYTVGLAVPVGWALLAGLGTVLVLGGLTTAFTPLGSVGGQFSGLPALFVAALLASLAVANHRATVAALAARADHAERAREEEARRRVDAERLRIARELHDVVAHTMATINVQAGAAVHVSTELPEPAATALRAIKDASKRGLGELRAILAVLRQTDADTPAEPPGLAALDTLVDTVTAAGLPTTVRTTGTPRPLPGPVDVAVYRIVQESLTNALRHAAPADATVHLTFAPGTLTVEVTDTGPGPAATPSDGGHGLRGMTERAEALGGTLTTGPGPHGGFRVHADLPTEAP